MTMKRKSINRLDKLQDELKIDIEGFNKDVITEEFNRVVDCYHN